MNRRGYEFSFVWIFAILVGAFVIFFAVYASTEFIGTKKIEQSAVGAKSLGTLLSPLETSLEESKVSVISVREDVEILNSCESLTSFGSQIISISYGGDVEIVENSFHNKYLFSSASISGNDFYVLSKPFYFPFKVGDLIMIWPKDEGYCFVKPLPFEMEDEIGDLDLDNFEVVDSLEECSESKSVCQNSRCDIEIDVNSRKIIRHFDGGKSVNYVKSVGNVGENTLILAGIFSDSEIYNCHVVRLLSRAKKLALIYKKKSDYLLGRGCGAPRLNNYFADYLGKIEIANENFGYVSFQNAYDSAERLGRENDGLLCRLF